MVMGHHLFGENCRPPELLNNICSILGTPNEEIWPGVTTLCPAISKQTVFPPKNLTEVVQGLEPAGINFLSNMLRGIQVKE
ncbi:cell division control protein 2 homolog [Apium graveolens]|uniref:cell division control protein 2 homolog n=1 Tax=Apium graveolens TaxID=4045 RepID=UPI003D7A1103